MVHHEHHPAGIGPVARAAERAGSNMGCGFTTGSGPVMTGCAGGRNGTVIHDRTFAETDGNAMTGIAGGRRLDMVLRFAACGHPVMAANTLLGRAFKYTPDVASFARYKLMLAGQRIPGGEMIKSEPLMWYYYGV